MNVSPCLFSGVPSYVQSSGARPQQRPGRCLRLGHPVTGGRRGDHPHRCLGDADQTDRPIHRYLRCRQWRPQPQGGRRRSSRRRGDGQSARGRTAHPCGRGVRQDRCGLLDLPPSRSLCRRSDPRDLAADRSGCLVGYSFSRDARQRAISGGRHRGDRQHRRPDHHPGSGERCQGRRNVRRCQAIHRISRDGATGVRPAGRAHS